MWTRNLGMSLVRSGGAAPVYTPLDLSAAIGDTGRYLVKLSHTHDSVSDMNIGLRPGDSASDLYQGATTQAPSGVGEVKVPSGKAASHFCITDGASVVDFIATTAATYKTYLHGWAPVTAYDTVPVGPAHEAGVSIAPAGAILDFSPELGAVDALTILQGRWISGSANTNRKCAFSPTDELVNVCPITCLICCAGPHIADVRYPGVCDMMVMAATGPTGRIYGVQPYSTTVMDFWIHGSIQDWERSDTEVFASAPPPVVWTDLDLSGPMGARTGLAYLRLEMGVGGGANVEVAFRCKDNLPVLDFHRGHWQQGGIQSVILNPMEACYVCVDTNDAGVVEWMTDSALNPITVTVLGFVAGGVPPDITSAIQVSPRCTRVGFSLPMRNNAGLRDPSKYTITGGSPIVLSDVKIPWAHRQEYVGPGQQGGLPEAVYLLSDKSPDEEGSTDVNVISGAIIDFYDGMSLGVNTFPLTTYPTRGMPYWSAPGLRVSEGTKELAKTGRAKYTPAQPANYGIAIMTEKISDIISGGQLGEIVTALDGPADPIAPSFSGAGFSLPGDEIPGIGDTVTFGATGIPCHVDKLWGACDGENELFRASLPFHAFACAVVNVPSPNVSIEGAEMTLVEWFAPDEGKDQLLRTAAPPASGGSLIAVYVPRQSLLRIDEEIIAYHQSNPGAGTAVICGRSQLCSELTSHASRTPIEDVWMASMVGRAQYSLLVFGASGAPLGDLAHDRGAPRSANPSLCDTELRRMVFNTAVSQRTTPGSVRDAIRYIYPDLAPYVTVAEDPRWPGCLTMWYSSELLRDPGVVPIEPSVEPWETWLDYLAWADGFDPDTLYESFYRDPSGDVSYEGDFYLADRTEDPPSYLFPLVLSGSDISIIGPLAPIVPPPSWVSLEYLNYITRPAALDRVLSAGVGILLIDIALL